MQTAGLLVVLAAIAGAIVLRTIWSDTSWGGAAVEVGPQPHARTGRGPRRLLTTTALTAALAVDSEEDVRPSFFGRSLAFVRLLLVIVFVVALAGGTFFWIATTIANKVHFHPG